MGTRMSVLWDVYTLWDEIGSDNGVVALFANSRKGEVYPLRKIFAISEHFSLDFRFHIWYNTLRMENL